MARYYKLIGQNNQSKYTNFDYTPYLPHDGLPGEWTPPAERPGWNVTDAHHLLEWRDARLFEVEVMEPIEENKRYVCRSIRPIRRINTWNQRTLRLFACWCVRQVWEMLEDDRSRNAVEVAERYANGKASDDELSLARAAAQAVTQNQPLAVTPAAAQAVTLLPAQEAAWYTVGPTAWAIAGAAAYAAAKTGDAPNILILRQNVRNEQNDKLIEMLGLKNPENI